MSVSLSLPADSPLGPARVLTTGAPPPLPSPSSNCRQTNLRRSALRRARTPLPWGRPYLLPATTKAPHATVRPAVGWSLTRKVGLLDSLLLPVLGPRSPSEAREKAAPSSTATPRRQSPVCPGRQVLPQSPTNPVIATASARMSLGPITWRSGVHPSRAHAPPITQRPSRLSVVLPRSDTTLVPTPSR